MGLYKLCLILSVLLLFTSSIIAGELDRQLAVLPFDGKMIEDETAEIISSLIRAEVQKTKKFTVVDRSSMETILKEQKIQLHDCTDSSCAVRYGQILNVRWIVVGSLSKLGSKYIVLARRVDVQSGEIASVSCVESNSLERMTESVPVVAKELFLENQSKPDQSNNSTSNALHQVKEVKMQTQSKTSGKNAKHGQVERVNLTDSIQLELIYLSGGNFKMGSSSGKVDQQPQHMVSLDGFWIGICEVTQEQYSAVMRVNPSNSQAPKNPVENVSWNDAMAFCKKLSLITGDTYILPTEAQWEYACRAGMPTNYNLGDSERCLDAAGWYIENSGYKTHDVMQRQSNDWGLFDMHGNIWEWCYDWYGEDYYSKSSGSNPSGPESGKNRVLRGGGLANAATACSSSSRGAQIPSSTNFDLGFRIVKNVMLN